MVLIILRAFFLPAVTIFSILALCQTLTCYAAQPLNDGIDELTAQIAQKLADGQKQRVAVIEFSDLQGRVTEFGGYVSEELITRLFKTDKIQVVERQLLDKVIEEHKLRVTGAIDEKTAKRFGRLIGADAICTGTVTDLGNSVKINARLISTETGALFAAASTEVNKDDTVKRLVSKVKLYRFDSEKKPRRSNGPKGNLIQNGGFTQRYEGWEKRIGDVTQGSSKTEVIPFSHGNSGKALHIKHQGGGHIQFSQIVEVPYADLIFSASFQASSHEGMIMAFSGTGVAQIGLLYLDEAGKAIGQTVLVNYVKNPFADTPLIGVPRRDADSYKTHYVEIQKGKFYKNYRIDIRREIEDNLLGSDIESLRKIAVIVWCGATSSQAGSELWITDISLRAK